MAFPRSSLLRATATLAILLAANCRPAGPDAPGVPDGPEEGGTYIAYRYVCSAVAPDGDSVAARFAWGDGDTSDWSALVAPGESVGATHFWTDTGTYVVRAQARNSREALSDWSDGLEVTVGGGWFRAFGGPAVDNGYAVDQTSDGGYVVAGYTWSRGAGEADVYLVRTDPAGETLWTRTYGEDRLDGGYSVQQTLDGGYVIVGTSTSFGSVSKIYMVKADALGRETWGVFKGFSLVENTGSGVQQTADGGYIIIGTTQTGSANRRDAFLIKTDAAGGNEWYQTKGYDDCDELGAAVQQTPDGGYIVAGTSYRDDDRGNVWLVRVSSSGGTTWHRQYGREADDLGHSVCLAPDGGYVVCGITWSPSAGAWDGYVIKTDVLGNVAWEKTIGGAGDDHCNSVRPTSDGGYILAGSTDSYGAGNFDAFLVKLDAGGNELWLRTYGGPGADFGYAVRQTDDGGYIVAGNTCSYGAGANDVFLVKTDAEGNCRP